MNQNAKSILRPLYIWGFIEALVFWYAIEKVLWNSVGITADQIIILGVLAQSSQILIEVPSSIIADRWSRRKTLMTSSAFMLLAIIIVLSIQSFLSFAIMSVVWAFYFAFQSGTINAYIYDLLKEKGEQSQYRKATSRYTTFLISGLLVASLGASILVKVGDLFTPYWVTIIPTVIAIILMWRMHDPQVDRTEKSTGTAINHVRNSLQGISQKKWLGFIFIALSLVMAGRFVWYEYYQLYALKQSIAPVLFGVMSALIHTGNLLGAEFAHRVKSPNRILMVSFAILGMTTVSLAFISGSIAIMVFLTACFFGTQAATIVLDESVQHETESELRATTLSLMGLTSRIFFGVAALIIILLGTTPAVISLMTLGLFLCALIYIPARRKLISPV